MSMSGSSMTLRSREKRTSEVAAVNTEHSDTHPRKRQRRLSEKAAQLVKPTAVTPRKKSSSRSRAVRSAAPSASPSKVAKGRSSYTPLKLEDTDHEDSLLTSFAHLRPAKNQRPSSSVFDRNVTQSKAATVLETTPTIEIIDSSSSMVNDTGTSRQKGNTTYNTVTALQAANKAKDAMIEELKAALARKDEESKTVFAITQGQRASELVKNLEDLHSCSLCFEVLACPYSLNSPLCGHTYCAMCLLKWFFTHLDTEYRTWHIDLECPLCRSPLPETSSIAQNCPRPVSTCPFIPSRHADDVITTLVNNLSKTLKPLGSTSSSSSPSSRKGKAKAGSDTDGFDPIFLDGGEEALGWKSDGASRKDWERRSRRGREAMKYLIKHWRTMDPHEFVRFKRSIADYLP